MSIETGVNTGLFAMLPRSRRHEACSASIACVWTSVSFEGFSRTGARIEGKLADRLTSKSKIAVNTRKKSEARSVDAADAELIAAAFDVDFYRVTNEDLPPGTDFLTHFMTKGWREGRDPAPDFSTTAYLQAYPDVASAGLNPFFHYLRWGKGESRITHPSSQADRSELLHARNVAKPHFDAKYYLAQRGPNFDHDDPLIDFLTVGWRLGLDPSADFSTSYYLEQNPDIRDGGINPFVHYIEHGKAELRQPLPYARRVSRKVTELLVSVVVPNYNHARYLDQRLRSVLDQTYAKLEVIVLDDASTDDSLKVIRKYRKDPRVRVIENAKNSGSVFAQWRRGFEAATGDLVWICESDDFCEPDFLAHIVREFADESVMIAFGRIQFAEENGKLRTGLDDYRESAERGIWNARCSRPAAQWFRGAFAVANVIPNVGGCVLRRQPVHPSVWERLLEYKVCGDWFLYAMLASGGRISYVPEAIAYFRQHGKNTSVTSFTAASYYREHEMLMQQLQKVWAPPAEVIDRFCARVEAQYAYSKAAERIGPLAKHFDKKRLMQEKRSTRHVLMAFLGFALGGGELVPIHLANELIARGYLVSMLCVDASENNARIRAMLDRRIAVYDAQLVAEMGAKEFIRNAGVDLVHSHSVAAEFFFFKEMGFGIPEVPYVSSLHGSYECTPVDDSTMMKIVRGVDHWVWLAEKNLSHLRDIPIDPAALSRIPNGMPRDPRPARVTRAKLKIGARDLVFTIASRALKEKGWSVAAEALAIAQKRVKTPMHLLLCGTGPEQELLAAKRLRNVHVLGFVEEVNGVYRMSDAVLLPTRFAGESFPLAIVQALQEGKPVISTDIGEIASMVRTPGGDAGIVLDHTASDTEFSGQLANAMVAMADPKRRTAWAATAKKLGEHYDIGNVAEQFIELYWAMWRRQAGERAAPRLMLAA